jgi:hypothetical protein
VTTSICEGFWGVASHCHVWDDYFFDDLSEDLFGFKEVGMSLDLDDRSQEGHCLAHELQIQHHNTGDPTISYFGSRPVEVRSVHVV